MNLMRSPGPYSPSTTFSSYIQSSPYCSLVYNYSQVKVMWIYHSTSNSHDSKLNSTSFPFSADDSSYRFYFHDKSTIHSLKLKTQKFLCFCSFTFHVQWLIIKQNSSNVENLSYLFYTPIPGLRSFSGVGNGNPTQYSCLGNPLNKGAWQDTVHGLTRIGYDLATKQHQQIWK